MVALRILDLLARPAHAGATADAHASIAGAALRRAESAPLDGSAF